MSEGIKDHSRGSADDRDGEVLVAIINRHTDLAILNEQGWYRIPVSSRPKRWPPRWLAFYQPKVFGAEAFSVRYFGQVSGIEKVLRRDLFPDVFPNPKSDREYYRVHLKNIETLPEPIHSARWRRITFISTTWRKFICAQEINDLYDESPLEDRLWDALKLLKINAERQYDLKIRDKRYQLDFAVFCRDGKIDVEADGDFYHANPERAAIDNKRNNDLATANWQVLRFNTRQVQEEAADYCVTSITRTINRLGGLSDERLVPIRYVNSANGTVQQLTLFEEQAEYEVDEDL